jgi:hypothetical protein
VLNEERSAKQREGMFLDLVHWFLCTNIYGLSAGNREKKRRKEMQKSWLSTAKVQLGLAHRTVRWCTRQCLSRKSLAVLGLCFGAPKVSHEGTASAEVVSKRWPKVPFHGTSAF